MPLGGISILEWDVRVGCGGPPSPCLKLIKIIRHKRHGSVPQLVSTLFLLRKHLIWMGLCQKLGAWKRVNSFVRARFYLDWGISFLRDIYNNIIVGIATISYSNSFKNTVLYDVFILKHATTNLQRVPLRRPPRFMNLIANEVDTFTWPLSEFAKVALFISSYNWYK